VQDKNYQRAHDESTEIFRETALGRAPAPYQIDAVFLFLRNKETRCQLPLAVFLQIAADMDRESSRNGQQPPGWDLARYCKFHPFFAGLTGREACARISWEILADVPLIDETQVNFASFFDTVQHEMNERLLNWAARSAKEHPLCYRGMALYDLFVSFAAYLQAKADCEIWFPRKTLAHLLGIMSERTVANLIDRAIEDGYLELVTKAITKQRAARYRFDFGKLDQEANDILRRCCGITPVDNFAR
jgi:hypothetical protein